MGQARPDPAELRARRLRAGRLRGARRQADRGADRRRASPPTPASRTSAGPHGVWTRDPGGGPRCSPWTPTWPTRRCGAGPGSTGASTRRGRARAERRPSGAGRPGAGRPAARDRHAEHRRPAPAGRQLARAGDRDPRHPVRGRVPVLRRPHPDGGGAGAGRRRRDGPACLRCGGILKSATISFGQALDAGTLRRAVAAASDCDLLLAVGTSLTVQPAAGLVEYAAGAGARVVIINAAADPVRPAGRRRRCGSRSARRLPALVATLDGDDRDPPPDAPRGVAAR